jgi:hypothetical protein
VDSSGNVYITDTNNNRIRRVLPDPERQQVHFAERLFSIRLFIVGRYSLMLLGSYRRNINKLGSYVAHKLVTASKVRRHPGQMDVKSPNHRMTPYRAILVPGFREAISGIHRPISARFRATFWKGFGGSPIPFYLTTSVRKQGQLQVPARLAQQAAAALQ